MKIVAFGASTSKQSINQQFAHFAAHQFEGDVHLLDLNDFEMPLFSVDREIEDGHPEEAYELLEIIAEADFLVISMAEHNGSYSAAFKNTLDWCSRINMAVFAEKPMLLLSTAPGGMGGKFVMESALTRFPRHAANVLAHFSLPNFNSNFENQKITNEALNKAFQAAIQQAKNALT